MPGRLSSILARHLEFHTATPSLMSVLKEGNLRRLEGGEIVGDLGSKFTSDFRTKNLSLVMLSYVARILIYVVFLCLEIN